MIGELEVKNRGYDERKSSLRHIFCPVAASTQESIPRTPSVTTFPSATAADARGPAKPPGSVEPCVSYFSAQSSFPLAASRHRTISLFSCREKTKSLSPTSAGVATPSPTGTFHLCVS